MAREQMVVKSGGSKRVEKKASKKTAKKSKRASKPKRTEGENDVN